MVPPTSRSGAGIGRVAIVAATVLAISGCNMLTRLSEVGDGPQMSPIINPTARPNYHPVSMPMPAPQVASRNPNSLWRNGARAFFRDQRASQVGDILTLSVNVNDSAALDNKTTRKRADTEDGDISALFGLESEFTKVLPQGITPAATVSLGTAHDTEGDGTIDRTEEVIITLAAMITQVLPNGNLVVVGRQEIRVNYEMRELIDRKSVV